MVSRDDRCGTGTPMSVVIDLVEFVGVGAVVLLEPSAVGREGRERCPRTILGEWVLRTDEAGGCDRRVGDRQDRHEGGYEQTAQESAQSNGVRGSWFHCGLLTAESA